MTEGGGRMPETLPGMSWVLNKCSFIPFPLIPVDSHLTSDKAGATLVAISRLSVESEWDLSVARDFRVLWFSSATLDPAPSSGSLVWCRREHTCAPAGVSGVEEGDQERKERELSPEGEVDEREKVCVLGQG